jgi:UDP-N-acetylmuramoyl-L-alanyl-D-glutamate--2,6-diaminopimelate ligase
MNKIAFWPVSFIKGLYHFCLSFIGAIVCGFPSRKIRVIGITGTKGKSTTAELLSFVLEKSGFKTAFLTSVHVKIGDRTQNNMTGNTMPGRFFIQKFLSDAVKNKCKYAIVEVTSQGVLQHRHKFIFWDKAVFLGIHPEHIEAHGSFENYLDAKLDFFRYAAKTGIPKQTQFFINKDDKYAKSFENAAGENKTILFSSNDVSELSELPFCLESDLNRINVAAVLSIAKTEGIDEKIIEKIINKFPCVRGRMELIKKEGFNVVIDYAHTPESLEGLCSFLRKKFGDSSKMICVLGSAGGGRDKLKRPKMGEIVSSYCDKIVLTNEDPFDESPEEIINQIEKGIKSEFDRKNLYKILDRRMAIKKALEISENGGVIAITGKGSEAWIRIENGKKIPWSEMEVVEEEMGKLKTQYKNYK